MSLKHLGIIADGNRRWAKENNLPKIEGHKKGLKTIEELVGAAAMAGIPYITFYVFSTENWGREESEVDYIMKLAETRILKMAEKMAANNIKLVILGSRGKVNPTLTSLAEKAEKITAECTGTTVCFCFNYGGEQEIADAANIAIETDGEITPATIRKHLYHPEVPDLDMVVRTSGEERLSGFMLWRAAYAELMFMKKYFPEMTGEDIKIILSEYDGRNRRFGK
ncbi:di-trans,poly-cis-decaprenylcistransferase [Candidatus Saccharibacteria bacterium]|jgi:undecaprenyl diphosphate synthase|nr:di-trans,poly-cis-decaprenylcistransferase [Candidatus Saccharibacteria bacterium]